LPVASNPPRSIASPARALALLLLCAACGFLIGTPYAVLDHQNFLAAVTAVRRHLAAGHVVMARGWPYHATFTFRYGLGIPLMIAASAGACWLIVERPRLAALVLAFPVPYYVVLGFGHTVFVRYLVPMVPFVCLTAAFLVDRAAELVGDRELMTRVRDASVSLYRFAAEHARERGVILADTKFEFGVDDDGELVVGDEVLTPDSSRYWPADGYQAGRAQPSFDKQYVRDWAAGSGWDKTPPAPAIPDDVVAGTRARYVEAYERITGEPFEAWRSRTAP
jgi:hypothetical protein